MCTNITNHLEWHQHAFLNEDNKVVDVIVFDENSHNSELLNVIANGRAILCCCSVGLCSIGETWNGTGFIPVSPFPSWVWNETKKEWEAPIPQPSNIDGSIYAWDENSKSWLEVIPQDEPAPNV